MEKKKGMHKMSNGKMMSDKEMSYKMKEGLPRTKKKEVNRQAVKKFRNK